MASSDQPSPQAESATGLWKLSAMGFTMACEIVAGLLLGWLVDRWTGTDKVFLIIGTIMGIIVGMTSFIRTAMKANKASSRRMDSPPPDQGPVS